MDPERQKSFELQVNMDEDAECFYELYIDKKSLDTKNNDYEWEIKFYSMANVIPSLS